MRQARFLEDNPTGFEVEEEEEVRPKDSAPADKTAVAVAAADEVEGCRWRESCETM